MQQKIEQRLLPAHTVQHAPGLEAARDARARVQGISKGALDIRGTGLDPGGRVMMLQHPTSPNTVDLKLIRLEAMPERRLITLSQASNPSFDSTLDSDHLSASVTKLRTFTVLAS
jgi:hypothetical protein